MKTKKLVNLIIIILVFVYSCKKEYIEPIDDDSVILYHWAIPGTIDSVFAIVGVDSKKTGNIVLKIHNNRSGDILEYNFRKDSEDTVRFFHPLTDWPYDDSGEIVFIPDDQEKVYKKTSEFTRYETGMVRNGPDFSFYIDSLDFSKIYLTVYMEYSWNSGKFYIEQLSEDRTVLKTDTFQGYNGSLKRTFILDGANDVNKFKIHWDLGDYHKTRESLWDSKDAIVTSQTYVIYDNINNIYSLQANVLVNTNQIQFVDVKSLVCVMPKQSGGTTDFEYVTTGLIATQNPIIYNWDLGLSNNDLVLPGAGFEVGLTYPFYFKVNWEENILTSNSVFKSSIDTFYVAIQDWVANELVDTLRRGSDSLGIVANIDKGELNIQFKTYNGATLIDDLSYYVSNLDTMWYVKSPNPTHFTLDYYKSWNNVKGQTVTNSMNWNMSKKKKK